MQVLGSNFKHARVLVVGDVMLDRYWSGGAKRISPEAPVPVISVDEKEQRAGGAGNVALNIAALGGQAEIFSIVGADEAAEDLRFMLESERISCHFETSQNLPTSVKLRILSQRQQLVRVDFEESFEKTDKSKLLDSYRDSLAAAKVVVLSDYGKGVLSEPQTFIELARKENIPVLIDPKGNDYGRYCGANLVTPNRNEFEQMAGICVDYSEMVVKATIYLKQHNIGAFLITLSEDGMMLVKQNGDVQKIPTKAREVFDVTGAGDTVIATFATALASGADELQAMEYANIAAGVVVAKIGTSTASLPEIEKAKSNNLDSASKIYEANALDAKLKSMRQGQKIIMTNGCFDLLHAGHVSYLQSAKNLGDKLIVAVNSDASVKRIKGDSRPIQALAQRMKILAALECVDFVVPFDEETPERLYCQILPDVLAKGGDYKPDDLAGAACVKASGGDIKVLHFVEGQSSSSIINKIREIM